MISDSSKHYLSGVLIFSCLLTFLGVIFFVLTLKEAFGSDFISYLTGAKIIRVGNGKKLYDLDVQYEYQQSILTSNNQELQPVNNNNVKILPYVNAPPLALFLIPLTYLNFLTAYKLFVFLNFSIYIILQFLIPRIFTNIKPLSFFVFIPFLFYPSFGALFVGQITPLLLLILFLMYFATISKKDLLLGLIAGLLFIKLQYIILIPYVFFMVRRRKDFLKGLILTMSLLTFISYMIAGGHFFNNYLNYILSVQKPEYGVGLSKMFTLHASLTKLIDSPSLLGRGLLVVNSFLYFISVIVLALAKNIKHNYRFALAVIWTMVFCVHSINYDYSLILIPVFIYINTMQKLHGNLPLDKTLTLMCYLLIPTLFLVDKVVFVPFLLLAITLVMIFPPKTTPIITD